MKDRIKWLLAGVGVMYATQLIVLLAIHYLIPHSVPTEFYNFTAAIVYTLLAFLLGGFVIGLRAGRFLIIGPTLAAVTTLLIDVLSTQAERLNGIFLFSIAVEQGGYGTALTIGIIAIVAAIAGGLAGQRWTLPEEDWVSQSLLILGLVGLLLGPFLLSVLYLPITLSIIIGLALLVGSVIAVWRFGRRRRKVEEISIRPENYGSSELRMRPDVQRQVL